MFAPHCGQYPNYDVIARNSDALTIAREESAIALLGQPRESGRRGGFGRRLRTAEENAVVNDVYGSDDLAELVTGKLVGEQFLHAHRRQLQTSSSSSSTTGSQPQQSTVLSTALLVVGARDGVANLYDDAGIEQLCRFRRGLMDDEATWADYCLMGYDADGNQTECNRGTDGLGMFFGDANYDIDTIDVSIFATPGFDAIVRASSQRNYAALASFPPTDVAAVTGLYAKLFGYLTGPWSSSTYVCDMSKKKNLPRVLEVLAHVREAESLESFNGILNQVHRPLGRPIPELPSSSAHPYRWIEIAHCSTLTSTLTSPTR